MRVDPAHPAATFDYEGQRFSFCSPGCRDRFRADPRRYLKASDLGSARPDRGRRNEHEAIGRAGQVREGPERRLIP
jgi:YHS domain-containing protein